MKTAPTRRIGAAGLWIAARWVAVLAIVSGEWPMAAWAEEARSAAPVRSHLGPLSADVQPSPHPDWPGQPDRFSAPPFQGSTSESLEPGGTNRCPECGSPGGEPAACGRGCRSHRAGLLGLFGGSGGLSRPAPDHAVACTSWLCQPYQVGLFIGFLDTGPLLDDWVDQKNGLIGGVRLGWDFDDYWGCELRYALTSVELADSWLALSNPARLQVAGTRHSQHLLLDASIVFYPWGDTRLRPYLVCGLGAGFVRFQDVLGQEYSETSVAIPVGVGLKYLRNERLAFRLEFTDTMIFAGEGSINTLHDLTLSGGVEFRFGGSRRSYWPWNPGAHYR